MAAFVAADVTYLMLNQRKTADSRNANRVRMTFGASTETYATGGIPVSKGKLGCPTVIESMRIVDQSTGYFFSYDQSAEKLMIFVAPAQTHTHDVKIMASITEDGAVGIQGAVFGKNSATNAVILGANSTLAGGVVSATLAAGAMTELAASTDIATQVIEVEVIGW
jgi:hypothetical protein